MLLAAQLTDQARNMLRAEAESTATKLSNMAWNTKAKGIPNELFQSGSTRLRPEHLIEFRRIGYMTIRKQIKKKWTEKSIKCVMVGYADDHSSNTYRMYDPMMGTVQCSRDVIWLEWKRADPKATMKIFSAKKEMHLATMTRMHGELDSNNEPDIKLGRNAGAPPIGNIPAAAVGRDGNAMMTNATMQVTTKTKKPCCT